uniref:Secreted protein n=1 Tax=Streptomyces sp. NBC_00008 TaxID=2903610 RepID=A0AAU2VPR0_9ACTN
MARHALSKSPRRALLRAGLTVTALGAALGAGGAAAQAAPLPAVPAAGSDSGSSGLGAATDAAGGALTGALGPALDNSIAPVTHLRLDPLAGTGTDPLDNAVGTQIADFKPVSTALVTDPVTSGGALKDLPLVGQVTGLLHS